MRYTKYIDTNPFMVVIEQIDEESWLLKDLVLAHRNTIIFNTIVHNKYVDVFMFIKLLRAFTQNSLLLL